MTTDGYGVAEKGGFHFEKVWHDTDNKSRKGKNVVRGLSSCRQLSTPSTKNNANRDSKGMQEIEDEMAKTEAPFTYCE